MKVAEEEAVGHGNDNARAQKAKTDPKTIGDGFDRLTLDPSPRLRRAREELTTPDETMAQAWKSAGRAIAEAMISLSKIFPLKQESKQR